MDEVQLPVDGQHVDRDQRFDRRRGRRAGQTGQAEDIVERHRRAEDGDRLGDVGGVLVQSAQPAADRASNPLGAELQHAAGVCRRTAELHLGHLGDQLAEQERVATGGGVAGGRELLRRRREFARG